ncbi:MAG: HEAT repeat domain-containing protein [Cyclobacteriaceae bacterium]|nr:HEAT repeat domain-containing protein [Cyclobacteriaceae bacterium]
MKKERIDALVYKYNGGIASPQELAEIESLLEDGLLEINALQDVQALDAQLGSGTRPSPTSRLDKNFYAMLRKESRRKQSFSWKLFFAWPEVAPKLAFGSATLILGLAIGFYFRPVTKDRDQIQLLSQQVNDLKEIIMLTLLEKESATDRLKAVSLSQEMKQASQHVTSALLKTLNEDDNVNVRLAALDALRQYAFDSQVRAELVRSISRQDSPLVQVALAELMTALQEKSSVKELERILHNERTPSDVKNKIKKSIDVLT